MPRWDIEWTSEGPKPVLHFCRTNGCYGTSKDHGYSWDEARDIILEHYRRPVIYWENISEKQWLKSS